MSLEDLPREILIDVLERLPAKTLIIFGSVCKSWYSLITDPSFLASHLNRGMFRSSGYLLHMPMSQSDQQMCHVICGQTFREQFELAFPFDTESFNMTVAGSCSGMLCVTDADRFYFGRTAYLWNPSIRKVKSLPRSPHIRPNFLDMRTWVVLGLGFDHVSGDHKIVRILYFWDSKQKRVGDVPNEIRVAVEVYTLRTNSWRSIKATVLCIAQSSSKALVNGSIHWIANKPKGPHHLILSFDFTNEVFQELMVPAQCYNGIGIHSEVLAGIHDSLSLLINGTADNSGMIHCCNMWVMKKYGVAESWVKQFKFVAKEGIYRLPGMTTEGEIIYQNNKMEWFTCDPVDGRHKSTGLHGLRFSLVAFTESLVLLDEHRSLLQ